VAIAYFITHPDVAIDPSVPVPDWQLSPEGIRRMVRLLDQGWVRDVRTVFTSAERKALDAARILAGHLSLEPVVIADLGENDRSATGFLPKAEFEIVADEFFAHPDASVRGWERAIDAQNRIVQAVNSAIAMASPDGAMAIVSHGAVGALLRCHVKGMPISRTEDQPAGGGGNLYSFEMESRQLLSRWRRIDE
jgi:broad specificity phosphatase PhoE